MLLILTALLAVSAVAAAFLMVALFAEDGAAMLGRDLSLSGRTIVWSASVVELAARPIFGFGYGAFWTGWDGPGAMVWAQVGWDPGDSHNGFLDAALDFGVAGSAILVVHVTVMTLAAIRWARSSSESPLWPIAFLVFFVIYNLTESSTFRPTNVLWVLYPMVSLQLASGLASASRRTSKPLDSSEHAIRRGIGKSENSAKSIT